MLKPASAIILDEATAYADPESEAQIQEAISRLVREKTLIVVAHRLSTIRNANQILWSSTGAGSSAGESIRTCWRTARSIGNSGNSTSAPRTARTKRRRCRMLRTFRRLLSLAGRAKKYI